MLPLAWSMDHVGPMTRSAADCALMLGAMAGYDPADASTSVLPVPDYSVALTGDVKGLRVGLLRGFFLDGAAPEVRAAVEAAARGAGRRRRRRGRGEPRPHAARRRRARWRSSASEALAYHAELSAHAGGGVRSRRAPAGCASAPSSTGVHYVRAQQVRALVRDEVDGALARRDVLLAPSTPIAAPRRRRAAGRRWATDRRTSARRCIRFTRPFNSLRPPVVLGAVRVHRGRAADRHAARRSAVRRGHRAARGRRVPAPHRLSHPTSRA